jgi:hypothetical protein
MNECICRRSSIGVLALLVCLLPGACQLEPLAEPDASFGVRATAEQEIAAGFRVSLSSSGSPAPADGASAVQVTATLTDSRGNVLTGSRITFSASGNANDVISPTTAVTNCQGQARTSIAANTAGIQTISATYSQTTARLDVAFTCPGPFLAPVAAPQLGGTGSGLAISDINGDKVPDLVAAHSSGISTFLGTGTGAFVASASQIPPAVIEVQLCDLNNDGVPDLVSVSQSNTNVTTSLGQGNGKFLPSLSFPTAGSPFEATCIDVNRDGNLDVVLGYLSSAPQVYLGGGDGSLQTPTNLSAGSGPVSNARADLNGDGYSDLVVGNFFSGSITVFLNNGTAAMGTSTTTSCGTRPRHLSVADFNRDGKLDVAVTLTNAAGVQVLFGNGAGGLPSSIVLPTTDAQPYWVVSGDLNNGVPQAQEMVVAV